MALNMAVLKNRLREAFGDDSQETVGRKLHMAQGNVSKLLSYSSSQQPTLGTVFHIAEVYHVSADWLLGISERKRSVKTADTVSYASAVEALASLCRHGAAAASEGPDGRLTVEVDDPLLNYLFRKSLVLSKTDTEIYRDWMGTKLAAFDDKPLISSPTWSDHHMRFLAGEAETDSNWLQVHDAAAALEAECAEMMGNGFSPFEE